MNPAVPEMRTRYSPKIFAVQPRSRVAASRFPIDMLRYDSCRPLSEADAGAIEESLVAEYASSPVYDGRPIRLLALATRTRITRERWLSFGWVVLDEEAATG